MPRQPPQETPFLERSPTIPNSQPATQFSLLYSKPTLPDRHRVSTPGPNLKCSSMHWHEPAQPTCPLRFSTKRPSTLMPQSSPQLGQLNSRRRGFPATLPKLATSHKLRVQEGTQAYPQASHGALYR